MRWIERVEGPAGAQIAVGQRRRIDVRRCSNSKGYLSEGPNEFTLDLPGPRMGQAGRGRSDHALR
jgi:hypothetical protein